MRKLRDLDVVRDLVRSANPLQEVLESYGVDLKPSGADSLKALCPFHVEHTPSFGVSLSKQVYFCYGCKAKGDVFRLVQDLENVQFLDAVRLLADRAGIDLSPYESEPTAEERAQDRMVSVLGDVAEWAMGNTSKARFRKWADERRFDTSVLREFNVGYSHTLPPIDESSGLRKRLLLDHDRRWEDVIVVPLLDEYGRVMGFRNRPFVGNEKVLGPSSKHPLPIPLFYGYHAARPYLRGGTVILVEGEPDVWQMVAHGIRNVLGLLGTNLTQQQLEFLEERGIRRVIVMPDGDKAGREFAMRVARTRYKTGLQLLIARLQEGDPDEVLLSDPDQIRQAIESARDVLEYLIQEILSHHDTETITGKADALAELRDALANLSAVRLEWVAGYLASALDTSKDALLDYFREGDHQEQLHNVAGERLVLRSMLEDEEYAGEALLALKHDDFYLERHKLVFTTIDRLYRLNESVTPEVVRLELLNRYGHSVATHFDGLLKLEPDMRSARFILDDLRDKAIRRSVRKRAKDLALTISDLSVPARSVVQEFTASVARVVVGQDDSLVEARTIIADGMSALMDRVANPDMIVGHHLGPDWTIINRTLHGMCRSRYLVIAGPSGDGKSTLMCAWLRRIAVDLNEPALALSFEMSKDSLVWRMVSNISGVEHDKLVTGYLEEEEVERVQDAAEMISSSPLMISNRGRTLEESIQLIRHDVLTRGTSVVFLDYIQLMRLGAKEGRNMARHEQLGMISNALQELAYELNITIAPLCQINREGVKRGESTKEDAGGAYQIGQDADAFLILRAKTKDEQEIYGLEAGDGFLVIDKNRHGRSKIRVHVVRDLACFRLYEANTAVE